MLRRAGGAGVGRLVAAAAETSSCVSAATAAAAFSSTSGSSLSSSLRSGLRSALSRCAEPSGRAAASASAAAAGRQWRVAPWQQVRRQWGGGRPSSGGWTDRRGYEHFDGRGSFLSMRSRGTPDGRRAVRWLVIIGGAGTVVWVRSRQEVPYTGGLPRRRMPWPRQAAAPAWRASPSPSVAWQPFLQASSCVHAVDGRRRVPPDLWQGACTPSWWTPSLRWRCVADRNCSR